MTHWAVAHLPDGTTRGLFVVADAQKFLAQNIASGHWPEGTRVEYGDWQEALNGTFTPVRTKAEFDLDCTECDA